MQPEFEKFPKSPRLKRNCVITEKLDGTNAQVCIVGDELYVGSHNRWLSADSDHYGFHKWCMENKEDLLQLGGGRHFGEWWGQGIQRRYDLDEKRFSLFNTARWTENRPECCHVVPILYAGRFSTHGVDFTIGHLRGTGSIAAPGFDDPEGVIVYHSALQQSFKVTIKNDEGKHKNAAS